MITTVKGRFGGVAGTIEVDEETPNRSRVEVEIDAASIDTGVEQPDEHLRSADFMDVERHPAITFRSTRLEGAYGEPGDSFQLAGDLTIRGTTREVVLDVTFEGGSSTRGAGRRRQTKPSTALGGDPGRGTARAHSAGSFSRDAGRAERAATCFRA